MQCRIIWIVKAVCYFLTFFKASTVALIILQCNYYLLHCFPTQVFSKLVIIIDGEIGKVLFVEN